MHEMILSEERWEQVLTIVAMAAISLAFVALLAPKNEAQIGSHSRKRLMISETPLDLLGPIMCPHCKETYNVVLTLSTTRLIPGSKTNDLEN